MARIIQRTIVVDLTTARGIYDYVIAPGVRISSLYIAELPAAVIQMAFEGKYPFRIYDGMNMDWGDCNWVEDGVSIISPALPGQVMQLQVVYYDPNAGGSLAVGNAQ